MYTTKANVYKIELLVIDTEIMSDEEVVNAIENFNYFSAQVKSVAKASVDWHDDHALNKCDTTEQAYTDLFKLNGRLAFLADDARCKVIDECIARLQACEELPGPRIRLYEAMGALIELKEVDMPNDLKLNRESDRVNDNKECFSMNNDGDGTGAWSHDCTCDAIQEAIDDCQGEPVTCIHVAVFNGDEHIKTVELDVFITRLDDCEYILSYRGVVIEQSPDGYNIKGFKARSDGIVGCIEAIDLYNEPPLIEG